MSFYIKLFVLFSIVSTLYIAPITAGNDTIDESFKHSPKNHTSEFLSKKNIAEEFDNYFSNNKEVTEEFQELTRAHYHHNITTALQIIFTNKRIKENLPQLHILVNTLCEVLLCPPNSGNEYSFDITFNDYCLCDPYNNQKITDIACITTEPPMLPDENNQAIHPEPSFFQRAYSYLLSKKSSNKKYYLHIILNLKYLRNATDIELIQTIAHEIGHVKHDHFIKQSLAQPLLNFTKWTVTLIQIPLTLNLLDNNFQLEDLTLITLTTTISVACLVINKKLQAEFLSLLSKLNELEADKEILNALQMNPEIHNYDIHQILTFLKEKILEVDIDHSGGNTHPPTEERYNALFKIIIQQQKASEMPNNLNKSAR